MERTLWMRHCTKPYSVLGLTQWTEASITHVLQIRIMKLQDLSQSLTIGFHMGTSTYIAQYFILGG